MNDKCPKCGSGNISSYVWGPQSLSSELTGKLKDGTIKLGGTCITFPCPTKHCNNCGADFCFVDSFNSSKPAE